MIGAIIPAVNVQDRDGAAGVLATIRYRYPWPRHVFADGGYAGGKLRVVLARTSKWTIQIVKRSDKAKGFQLIPRRWVVERAFAWLSRNRRLPISHLRLHETPNLGVHETGSRPFSPSTRRQLDCTRCGVSHDCNLAFCWRQIAPFHALHDKRSRGPYSQALCTR